MLMKKNSGNGLSDIYAARPISDKEFKKISEFMYKHCRLNLHDGKKELVQTRLNKRLRLLGMDSYDSYLQYVESEPGGNELTIMVDSLTTNMTYFFRENDHFDYLKKEVFSKINGRNTTRFRVWSAGCSSGEEPYSLAIVMKECVQGLEFMDALILASDISTRVLQMGVTGEYSSESLKHTNPVLRNKYFDLCESADGRKKYRVKDSVKKLVRFRRLNLMDSWPIQGKFDVIFCRNVMIYFDKQTQQELLNRFYSALQPGGLFLVGHSESLSGIKSDFKYVGPMIYGKE